MNANVWETAERFSSQDDLSDDFGKSTVSKSVSRTVSKNSGRVSSNSERICLNKGENELCWFQKMVNLGTNPTPSTIVVSPALRGFPVQKIQPQ